MSIINIFIFVLVSKINGEFVYALDDPYIHLSMSKHLFEQLIFSVDGFNFASASSSPFWFMLLALFMPLGELVVFIPFVLNVIFQTLTLISIVYFLQKIYNIRVTKSFLFVIFVLTPFIALSLGGMEHSLQIFLVINLIFLFLSYLETNKNFSLILLFAFILVATRYESLATIFMLSFVLIFFYKNILKGVTLFLVALSPIFLFGFISSHFDLGFFPSSIMAKSIIGDKHGFEVINVLFENLKNNLAVKHILFILFINLYILYQSKKLQNQKLLFLSFIFLGTLFAHATFGKFGWLFRYEAYLIVLTFLNIYIYLNIKYNFNFSFRKLFSTPIFIFFIIFVFFFNRQVDGNTIAVKGTINIFEQQIQMSNFLKKYYNNGEIAGNDIGAITYFTNIHLLDLFGLGSYEIIELKKSQQFNSNSIEKILKKKNIEIIMIYEHWFYQIDFSKMGFTKIGTWKIKNNVVCGGDTVLFLSKTEDYEKNLQNFIDFSEQDLPKNIIVNISEHDSLKRLMLNIVENKLLKNNTIKFLEYKLSKNIVVNITNNRSLKMMTIEVSGVE
jgi:hypothetical protein